MFKINNHILLSHLSLFFTLLIVHTYSQKLNNRPIIGILTTPSDFQNDFPAGNWSYIPSEYIKYIEAAGGRVMPIPYDATPENITYLFGGTNGLLFPGGDAYQWLNHPNNNTRTATNITLAATLLIDLAIKANNNGIYYPIWGTCQGFQLINLIISQNLFLFDNVTGDSNANRNISFTYNAQNSKLWGSAPIELLQEISDKSPAHFAHVNAISVEAFYRNELLYNFINLLGITYASYGRSIVASIEAKNYPIYGSQFHPEKNPFGWQPYINNNHQPYAILFSQYCGNFLVQEARKNNQSFSNQKVLNQSLIYNWNVVNPSGIYRVGTYMFPTVAYNPQAWPVLFGNYNDDDDSNGSNDDVSPNNGK